MVEAVKLEHVVRRPFIGPAMVEVRDVDTGQLIFEDTLHGAAHWLEMFGFQFFPVFGVWCRNDEAARSGPRQLLRD